MEEELMLLAAQSPNETPLSDVAERLSLDVQYSADLGRGVSGTVEFQWPNFLAKINSNDSPGRQRFTLAHECGHMVFHADLLLGGAVAHRDVLFGGKPNPPAPFTESDERLANKFAASLLMPEDKLRQWNDSLTFDFDSQRAQVIGEWARRLKVSELALGWRLFNLNISKIRPT